MAFTGAFTALVSLACGALAAPAASCGADGRPWVAARAAAHLPASIRGFVELLRAELASRGIGLCSEDAASPAGSPPIATIDVSSSPDEVTLAVDVRDAVTAKHVSRDVSLAGVPGDSRPLTIALAADELLRASWAELALRSAPPPPHPVPVEVTRTVHESVVPEPAPLPSRPHVLLGVDAALEHFGSGATFYGADARFAAWIVPRLAAMLRLGLRSGAVLAAPDGDIQPQAWLAGAGVLVALTPPESTRWGLDAVARIDLEHVAFTPTPRAPATGATGSDFSVVSGIGAQAWLRVAPTLRVGAQAVALLPLRPVDATDASVQVGGVSGAGVGGQIGLWSAL